jgi:hypothetical protein
MTEKAQALHRLSEWLVQHAQMAAEARNWRIATALFHAAAQAEGDALRALSPESTRTRSALALSAAQLYRAGGDMNAVIRVVRYARAQPLLPEVDRELGAMLNNL